MSLRPPGDRPPEELVVGRWITTAGDPLARLPALGAYDLAGGGRLTLDRGFGSRVPAISPTWATTGRVRAPGIRLARFARVEIELAARAATAFELSLRPVCRHVPRWGARRRARYFDAAHRSADELARHLRGPRP